MWNTLLITCRDLIKNARFTSAITLVIAVIIAGCAFVFAVGHGVIYKPLPYPDEQRLVTLTTRFTKTHNNSGLSVPHLEAIASGTRTLETIVAYRAEDMSISDDNGRYAGMVKTVTTQPEMFALLGVVRPALGRIFVADDTATGAPPRAVIGWDFWESQYGGSRSVLERTLRIDGRDHRVVGVLPEGFGFPQRDQQVWLPLGFTEAERALSQAGEFLELRAVGRLKPGQSMSDASVEMMRLARSDPALEHMTELTGLELRAQPLRDLWVGERELSLKLMLLAVLVVLLAAAVGVCCFYFVHLYNRQVDFARSTHQMLCEVALLCALGGAIGAALALLGLRLLPHFGLVPAGMPQTIGGDWVTAVFVGASVAVIAAAMILSGLAFQRRNAYAALRLIGSDDAARYSGRRVQRTLHMVRIALALVFFIGVGLLGLGLYSDWRFRQDVGFERSGLLAGRLEPFQSPQADDLARQRAALAAWMADVSLMPEVDAVGLTNSAPFGEDAFIRPFHPPSTVPLAQELWPRAYVTHVSAQHFRALDLPILRGRAFEEEEVRTDAPVAIIDEDIAQRYFNGAEPIGKTLSVVDGSGESPIEVRVVGVVAVARQRTPLSKDEYPTLYRPVVIPYRVHNPPVDAVEVLVRTRSAPAALADALQDHLAKLAPELRFTQLSTMKQRIADMYKEPLRRNLMLEILGSTFALLAVIGFRILHTCKTELDFYDRFGRLRHYAAADFSDPDSVLLGPPVIFDLPVEIERELGKRTLLITSALVFGLQPIFLLGLVLMFQLYGSNLYAALSLLVALVLFGVLSVLGLATHWRPAYQGSEARWLKEWKAELRK